MEKYWGSAGEIWDLTPLIFCPVKFLPLGTENWVKYYLCVCKLHNAAEFLFFNFSRDHLLRNILLPRQGPRLISRLEKSKLTILFEKYWQYWQSCLRKGITMTNTSTLSSGNHMSFRCLLSEQVVKKLKVGLFGLDWVTTVNCTIFSLNPPQLAWKVGTTKLPNRIKYWQCTTTFGQHYTTWEEKKIPLPSKKNNVFLIFQSNLGPYWSQ